MQELQRESTAARSTSSDVENSDDPFTTLYKEHSAEIFGFLIRLLDQRDLAEETLQETYIKVMTRPEAELRALDNPRAWLFTIARRTAIDCLRREGRHRADALDLHESSVVLSALVSTDQVWADLAEQERQQLMLEVTQELRVEDRAILLLYVRGLSFREMSRVLGCSHPTAKKQFLDATKAFSRALMARRIFGKEDL